MNNTTAKTDLAEGLDGVLKAYESYITSQDETDFLALYKSFLRSHSYGDERLKREFKFDLLRILRETRLSLKGIPNKRYEVANHFIEKWAIFQSKDMPS